MIEAGVSPDSYDCPDSLPGFGRRAGELKDREDRKEWLQARGRFFQTGPLTSRSRANVYVLLSRLFSSEVDDPLLEWLSSEETLSTLASLNVDTSPLATCHVKEDSPEKEDLLDDLAAEYAALFILPGDLSPYESVRLKGQLCQEPEWKVRQFYLDCGLVVKENTKIFADHIGAELGFLAYLAEKEADALDSGDDEAVEKWQDAQSGFFGRPPWLLGLQFPR